MNFLIDTVTIVRHFSGQGNIGKKAKEIIADAESGRHTLFISVVSLFEIMYLAEKNRIKISLPLTISAISKKSCYQIVDLTTDIILVSSKTKFYELHDRLILGTALHFRLSILSSDTRFDEVTSIKRVW